MPPRKPDRNQGVEGFKDEVYGLWGKVQVFTTAPALTDMEEGTLAFGNASEAAPAAASHALYAKVSSTTIAVISTNGVTVATRFIT